MLAREVLAGVAFYILDHVCYNCVYLLYLAITAITASISAYPASIYGGPAEAWETGLLRLGEPLGASWGNPVGQPAAPGL